MIRASRAVRKGGIKMYTEYGYIGEDGIEYATIDEAYEAMNDP